MVPSRQAAIPVSIVTGFLGSGKTTLLNGLLADPAMAGTMVIVNEFGAVGLDHLLVARPREDVALLASGCLCCTMRGDLVMTLTALRHDRGRAGLPWFDRILVETTGLAEPAPLLTTLLADEEIAPDFRLNAVVATVDAVNGRDQIAAGGTALRQVCAADHVLLTKTDLADADAAAALEADLRRLNPGAAIRRILHGRPDPLLVADIDGRVERPSLGPEWLGLAPDGLGTDANPHADILTFAVTLDDPVTPAGLETWMNLMGTFRGPDLLRLKGLLNVNGRPVVLQAVQHLFHPLEELAAWPSADRRSHLVFITRRIDRDSIMRTLDALTFTSRPRGDLLVDPKAYEAFAALAQRFR